MKRFVPIIFMALSFVVISCGGGKSGDPVPVITPPVVIIPPTTGNTGGGGTGGGGTGGTTYTVTTTTINTIGGTINYDVANDKVTKTLFDNANGGGIQTADGGTVSFELLNATNAKVTNLGDALELTFAPTEDPIIEYTVINEMAKTKTKIDVHINKNVFAGTLFLQGYTLTSFKNTSIIYDAAYVISKAKSSTQTIQKLAYK